jgi:hypothetical protein
VGVQALLHLHALAGALAQQRAVKEGASAQVKSSTQGLASQQPHARCVRDGRAVRGGGGIAYAIKHTRQVKAAKVILSAYAVVGAHLLC